MIFCLGALISGYVASKDYSNTSYWIGYTLFMIFLGGLIALVLFQIIYPIYLKFKK